MISGKIGRCTNMSIWSGVGGFGGVMVLAWYSDIAYTLVSLCVGIVFTSSYYAHSIIVAWILFIHRLQLTTSLLSTIAAEQGFLIVGLAAHPPALPIKLQQSATALHEVFPKPLLATAFTELAASIFVLVVALQSSLLLCWAMIHLPTLLLPSSSAPSS